MTHQTRDIYTFNLLRSSKLEISSGYGYLLSRLVDIESKQSSGQSTTVDFARQVLETYISLESGFDVGRVCLAFCSPFSRKLSIVSSYNTDDTGVTDLVPGYHCYVSPQSSLFATPFGGSQFGRIRVYSDIEKIIRSFTSRGIPVQRTVGKLAAAGFRSGLSLSLSMGAWGSGLLFLNSKTLGAFDSFEDADYLSTCILRMVAGAAIFRSEFSPRIIDQQLSATVSSLDQVPNVCEPSKFAELLTKTISLRFGIMLKLEAETTFNHPFFYPSQTAILIILKAMESMRFDDLEPIRLSFSTLEPDLMRLRLDFGARQPKHFLNGHQSVSSLAESTGFEMVIHETGFDLTTQYQHSSDVEVRCDYSTYS